MFTEHSMHSQLRFTGSWESFCLEDLCFFVPSDRRGEHVESWLSLLNSYPPWWSEPDWAQGGTPTLYLWTDSMNSLSRRDDFEPRWFQHFVYEECYLPLSGLLPIYLT